MILFDLGADHSFILHQFGRKLSLSPQRLNCPVPLELIELTGGRNVYVSNKL